MLNKKEKASYGAFIDYFLEGCEVVSDPFSITHIHVIEHDGIPSGIYGYEPKTGILELDDEHFGMLEFSNAMRKVQNGKSRIVFLKNKNKWEEMEEGGLIKKNEDMDIAKAAQGMMKGIPLPSGMVQGHAAIHPQQTQQGNTKIGVPTPRTGGFLKKLFGKN